MPQDTAAIQAWLVDYLSRLLKVEPQTIDVQEPFENFGLSSMDAVGLSGELESWLGIQLSPMLVYTYPTIESLAGYLAEESGQAILKHDAQGASR
ncbi:MAG TPA: acyl carrier protein [Chloroflexia bacterium]|jgi:acyl carrier protein